MLFAARWPDGEVQTYYSPSLIVAEYLTPGTTYPLSDFLERSRAAMRIASERVEAKYGFACSRAAHTLALIEMKAHAFAEQPDASVYVEPHEARERAADSSESVIA